MAAVLLGGQGVQGTCCLVQRTRQRQVGPHYTPIPQAKHAALVQPTHLRCRLGCPAAPRGSGPGPGRLRRPDSGWCAHRRPGAGPGRRRRAAAWRTAASSPLGLDQCSLAACDRRTTGRGGLRARPRGEPCAPVAHSARAAGSARVTQRWKRLGPGDARSELEQGSRRATGAAAARLAAPPTSARVLDLPHTQGRLCRLLPPQVESGWNEGVCSDDCMQGWRKRACLAASPLLRLLSAMHCSACCEPCNKSSPPNVCQCSNGIHSFRIESCIKKSWSGHCLAAAASTEIAREAATTPSDCGH